MDNNLLIYMVIVLIIMAGITIAVMVSSNAVKSKVRKNESNLKKKIQDLREENMKLNKKINDMSDESSFLRSENMKFLKMVNGFSIIATKSESDLFNIALDLALSVVSEARAGSISMINGKKWNYMAIHGSGEDIEKLKSLDLKSEWMVLIPKITVVENIMQYNEKVPKEYSKLVENAVGGHIYRSIVVPLKIGEDLVGNCFLDALDDVKFSESSKKISEEFGILLSTILTLKKSNNIESINVNNMLRTMVSFHEMKNSNMRNHSENVAYFAQMIGNEMNFSPKQMDDLYWGAILHDIGMIAVPDEIVEKPVKLTDEEFETMKTHTLFGEKILSYHEHLREASLVAKYHHEKFDGSGYPEGLKGGRIPLLARIIAIADAFETMKRDKNYALSLSNQDALKILESNVDIQFDPEILKVAIKVFEKVSRGR